MRTRRPTMTARSSHGGPSARRRGLAAGLLIAAGCLLCTHPASAQSAPPAAPASAQATPSQADLLFEQGQALMEKKDYDAACARFEASQKLDPGAGTLFNLATCEEGRGRFATAARRWKEGIGLLPPGDTRLREAMSNARAAQARAGSLVLRLAPGSPSGTTVVLDGRTVDKGELEGPILVDPGEHDVTVTAPGREPVTLTPTTRGGKETNIPVEAGPVHRATPGPNKPVSAPGKAAPNATTGASFGDTLARHKASLSLVGGGIAVAAVGAGVVSGVGPRFHDVAVNCNKAPGTCTQADFAPVKEQANIANALFGVAGAAGVAAVLVFALVEKPSASAPPGVSVAVGPAGGTLTVRY